MARCSLELNLIFQNVSLYDNENLHEQAICSSVRSYSPIPHIVYRGDMWMNEVLLVDLNF